MINGKIRILQIGMSQNLGGIESYLIQQYRALDKNKVQYDFVDFEYKQDILFADEIKGTGGVIYKICSRRKNPFKHYWQWCCLMCKIHSQYQGIVLNANSLYYVFPLFLGKIFRLPFRVIHSHNTQYKNSLGILRLILVYINRLIIWFSANYYFACSQVAGEWMFGINTKFEIINNAIDVQKFRYNPVRRKIMRAKLGLQNDFVVGHIGRFSKQKNHYFLIDIFVNLLKCRPKAKLLLLGSGTFMNEIQDKINKLGLIDKVILVGLVSNPEDYYQAMDCFVLPSLYEGLPIVGVEAQASGLPCLFADTITKEIGITDMAEFIPITDFKIWINKISNLKKNLDRAKYAGKVSCANYDIVTEVRRLEKFYLEGKLK